MNCYALNTHLPWLEVTCCLLETLIVASLIQNSFHSSEVFFPAESVSDCSDCSQLRLKSSYCLIVANKNSRDHFTIVCSVSLLCTVDSFFRNEAKLDVANIKTLTLNSVKCPYVANPFAGYDYNNNIKLPVTSGAFMVTKRKGSFLRRGDLTGRRTDNDYLCEMDNDTYMHLAYNSSNHSRHFDLQKPCTPQHCSCNITHVNSVGKKYDTVRRSMFISFPHLIHLNLSNNIIINIEDNAFVDIKGLRVLDLSNNQIRNLHEGLFLPLTHLQVLNISDNFLNETIFDALRHVSSIEILILKSNLISEICENCFERLQSLKILDLSRNIIMAVDHLQHLNNLEFLDLSFTSLTNLSATTFHSLSRLTHLRLANNELWTLSESLFEKNTELLELDITDNGLERIPNLSNLSKLITLKLGLDNIVGISLQENEMLCSLPNLQYLDLDVQGPLGIETTNFLNCQHTLLELHVETCGLKDVFLLSKASVLDIDASYNSFTYFSFASISQKVVKLEVDNNKIATWLDEHHNIDLKDLKIEILKLNDNQLKVLTNLRIPPSLQFLDLSRNMITSISFRNLSEAVALQTVKLNSNRIVVVCHLLKHLIKNPAGPTTLLLMDNPLVCACEIKTLQKSKMFDSYEDEDCINSSISRFSNEVSEDRFYCGLSGRCQAFECNADSRYVTLCGIPCPSPCACFVSGRYDFYVINCTLRNLTHVPTIDSITIPFSVDLSRNFLMVINSSTLSLYLDAQEIYFNSNHLKRIENNSFVGFDHLQVLDLSFNDVTELPEDAFVTLKRLKELYLNDNHFTSLHSALFRSLNNLEVLHLHNNYLHNFPVWELTFLKSLTLGGLTLTNNPWSCECGYFVAFKEWLIKSPLVDRASELSCFSDTNPEKKFHFLSVNVTICDNRQTIVISDNIAIWVCSFTLPIIIIAIAFLIYVYREEIQVLIYFHYGVRPFSRVKLNDIDKRYDVFVAYSSEDEQFVAEQLIPGLEGIENPYKVCVHHRDFLVGAYITDNILEAVDSSCRTIVVLSQSFVDSGWCRFEFQTAHNSARCDRVARLIVILLGSIPVNCDSKMKLYLKTNTYLKWGDKWFWKKLYFALPDRNKISTT